MSTWITRPETAADIPAIREINLAAFPSAEEADLVEALRADPAAWIDGLSMSPRHLTGPSSGMRC